MLNFNKMICYGVLLSGFLVLLANGQTSPSYRCKIRQGKEPHFSDTSCETFYVCSEFAGQLRKCRGGQQFHYKALECKPDEEVWCNEQRSNLEKTTTPAPTTTTAAPTTAAKTTAAETTAAPTTAAPTTAAPTTAAPAEVDGVAALLAALFPQLNAIPGIGNLIPGLGGQQAIPNALGFDDQIPVGLAPGVLGGNGDPLGGGVPGPFGLRGVLPNDGLDAGDGLNLNGNGVDGGTIVITPDDGDGPIVIQAVVPNPNIGVLQPGQVNGEGNGVNPGSGPSVQGGGQDGVVSGGGGFGNGFNVPQAQPNPFSGLSGTGSYPNINIPQSPSNLPGGGNGVQGQVRPPNTQGQIQPNFGQGPVFIVPVSPGQNQSNPNSTNSGLAPGTFSPTQGQVPFSPNQSPSQFSPNQSPSQFSPNPGSSPVAPNQSPGFVSPNQGPASFSPPQGQNPFLPNPGQSNVGQSPNSHPSFRQVAPAAFFPQVLIPAAALGNGQILSNLKSTSTHTGQRKLQSIVEDIENTFYTNVGSGKAQTRVRRSLSEYTYAGAGVSGSQHSTPSNTEQQRLRDTRDISSTISDGMSFASNFISIAQSLFNNISPTSITDTEESKNSLPSWDHRGVDKQNSSSQNQSADLFDLGNSFSQIGDAVLDAFSSVINLLHNPDHDDDFHTSFQSSPLTPSVNPVDKFLNMGRPTEDHAIVPQNSDNNNDLSKVLGEMVLQGKVQDEQSKGDDFGQDRIAKVSINDTFNGDSPPHGYIGGSSFLPQIQNDTGSGNSTSTNSSIPGIANSSAKLPSSVTLENNTVVVNGNHANLASVDGMNATSNKKNNSKVIQNWLKIEIEVPVALEVENDTVTDTGSTTHTQEGWSLTLTISDNKSQIASSIQNHIKTQSGFESDHLTSGQGNGISNTFNHHFTFSNSHHTSSSSSVSNTIPTGTNSNTLAGQFSNPSINSGPFQNSLSPFGDNGKGNIPAFPFVGNGIQSQNPSNGHHGSAFSPFGSSGPNPGINLQGQQGGSSSHFPSGSFPWGQMGSLGGQSSNSNSNPGSFYNPGFGGNVNMGQGLGGNQNSVEKSR